MVRNFTIHNDRLTSTKYPKGVTGNVNTYVCQFDIACDIDNLIWFCIFEQGESVIVREIVDNKCLIPQEVLIVPEPIYIGCYATNGKEDDMRRVSTNMLFFDMKQGSYREGTQPTVPTPDVWETLINKNVPIIGNNGNWFIWDIEEYKYVDSGKPSQGGGEGGSVDLSNYYTIDETDRKIASAVTNLEENCETNISQMRTSIDNQLATMDGKDRELQQNIYDLQAHNKSLEDRVEYLLEEVEGFDSALDELHNYAQSLIGGDAS